MVISSPTLLMLLPFMVLLVPLLLLVLAQFAGVSVMMLRFYILAAFPMLPFFLIAPSIYVNPNHYLVVFSKTLTLVGLT